MFSTISELFFGSSTPSSPPSGSDSECQGQENLSLRPDSTEDDWVIVKNEEESFLLSTEVVTRNRVNLHEDLSRENFLIENPLSLSSDEIEQRVIKIGHKSKRKSKRQASSKVPVRSSKNYQALLPHLRNPVEIKKSLNPRALTLLTNNKINAQGFLNSSVGDKRRGNYHYRRYSGFNNDRRSGQQRRST